MFVRRFCCVCLLLLAGGLSHLFAAIDPARVVVVANESDKASVQLARFYLEKRGIPEQNLILVKTSTRETITWDEFVSTLLNPLREQLVAKGWIVGSLTGVEDRFGRSQLLLRHHKMDFMVLCRLPLRISRDARRADLEAAPGAAPGAAPATAPANLRTNEASVDAELSLLPAPSTPLGGPLPNPLMGQTPSDKLVYGQVVRVARLDGPPGIPEKMIETGLEAEQIGLRGMAYIDLGHRHPSGDEWLNKAAALLAAQHYPVVIEPEKRLMGWGDRIDGAAFYFGWYSSGPVGPLKEAGFAFPPGALGWHIYSYSASRIRGGNGWAVQLMRSGITGTVGNVYEPYLHLTHRPDLFVEALAKGMSAGEAAYYALPSLSWMCLYAGDPLYRPFLVGLDAQLAQIEADPASPGAQYVVLRQAERLRAQSGAAAAYEYLEASAQRIDGLALAYALAREQVKQVRERRAAASLVPFLARESFSVADTPLAWQASELLVQIGRRREALAVLQKILSGEKLSDDAWLYYAPAAAPLARQFGELELAAAWEARVKQIEETRAEERARRAAEKKAKEQAAATAQ